MKYKLTTLSFGLLLAALCLPVNLTARPADEAADEFKEYGWQDKLKRGFLNILTSPVEIARSIHLTSEEHNLLAGWTWGLIKGLGSGIWRLGGGVVELVTFPFEFPYEDKSPLIEPEYVWQKSGVRYA